MVRKRKEREKELDREVRDHMELDAQSKIDRGINADEARYSAQRDFGNEALVKEVTRETWGWASLERVWQDVRFGLRTLRKSPAFTTVAVLTLALGIGVNATVFTIANAMVYKNLPFTGSDRVLYVSSLNRQDGSTSGISYPDFKDFRAQVKSFDGLGAMVQDAANISDAHGQVRQYPRLKMSANGFSVIGQQPVAGRDFVPSDEQPGAAPVAILSYGIWETRYASDPGIIGKSILVNQKPTTIVGVMSRGMQFPGLTDVWMPLIPTATSEKRDVRDLSLFGKIAKGTTLNSATVEMNTIAHGLSAEYPATNKDVSTKIMTFVDYYNGGKLRAPLTIMLWAVGFVLMIACANVANLLLGRAVGRSREVSIRAALGASRWRVIRQLLAESMILSVAGGGLGWLAAIWGARTFDVVASANGKPAFMTVTADYTVLAYMAAITLGTGILFGLAPALRLSKLDINLALKDGGHGTSGGKRGKYLSSVLVVAEMSLAVVLLVGAGLTIQSFMNVFQAPIGVRSDHVLTMRMSLPVSKYPRPADEIAFCNRLEERLAGLPGVDSVAVASSVPGRVPLQFEYELEGAPTMDLNNRPQTEAVSTSPAYFRVMSAEPHTGRSFTESDGVAGYPTVIVNDSFAATVWPHESPLGKRLRLITSPVGSPPGTAETPQQWLTVVGVAPNIVQNAHTMGTSEPIIYLPYREQPVGGLYVFARTNVPPGNLAEPFRRAVEAVDEDLPIINLMSLDESLASVTWGFRIMGAMFGIFGAIALVLASIGLYAVIAHSVSQRTQELGVRIALGATSWGILRLVFTQGMKQLGIGLAVGFLAALGVTQVLTAMLVGVKPWDPITFVSVAFLLTLAGALGCVVPARRATRVVPVEVLRNN